MGHDGWRGPEGRSESEIRRLQREAWLADVRKRDQEAHERWEAWMKLPICTREGGNKCKYAEKKSNQREVPKWEYHCTNPNPCSGIVEK